MAAEDPFARAKQLHYNAKKSWKSPLITSYGEKLFIAGDGRGLGNWDTNRARRMDFDEGNWRATMEVSSDQLPLEYRYMIIHDATKNVRWESSPKRKLEIPFNHEGDYVVRFPHSKQVTDLVMVPYETKTL